MIFFLALCFIFWCSCGLLFYAEHDKKTIRLPQKIVLILISGPLMILLFMGCYSVDFFIKKFGNPYDKFIEWLHKE